jgi:predicted Zn-dependent protease
LVDSLFAFCRSPADTLVMVNDTNPTDSRPAPAERSSNRPLVAAVLVLGAAVLVIGGIALRSAMRGPSPAVANDQHAKEASSAALQAGLEAAAKYQRDNQFAQAVTILSKLAESNPQDQSVHRAYGQALIGLKEYKQAYEQYEAAVSLIPAGATKQIAQGADSASAQLHFEAGTCAMLAGQIDRAIEHYSMAQTADPREPKYPLYLAMVQVRKGEPEADSAATANLLRAAKLNPDLAEAWGTLAELELRKDQRDLASQHITEARKLQPAVAKWRLVEAKILNRKGEPEQAAALLLALDESQRYQAGVLTVLGESCGLMRKPADAAKMYADAFSASSNGADGQPNAEFAYQAALWSERAGDKAEAAKFATTASMLGHADAKGLAERLKSK